MKNYLTRSKKSKKVKKIINEALEILDYIGIPIETNKVRSMEQMGMGLLALLDVTKDWKNAKCADDGYGLTSKEVITYFNNNFEENASLGSYDDVPRRYIKLLIIEDFVIKSGINPKENYNSSVRKYAIPGFVRDLVCYYNTAGWEQKLFEFNANKELLRDKLKRERNINLLPVTLPDGQVLTFSPGNHNELQKQIIEKFLPRFGAKSKLLYLGDGANKSMVNMEKELKELNFFDLSHGMLPDIVAYSEEKNWLFLIEAFFSTGTISEIRMMELKKNLSACNADIIFVTAFQTRDDFKKNISDIAWETEVWIASEPDHLVHFNGHKFLGAYQQ